MAGGLVIFLGFLVGVSAFSPNLTSELTLRLCGSAMNFVMAVLVLFAGTLVARFVARGVLISLVNMNVDQARLISTGVRWLITIFATAMALDHVQVGGRIVELAFAILFGGIVLTLALAVGLRSKDLAEWSRSRPPGDEPRSDGVDHL
jgi:predicted Co/Zn/Cd cation transporter (cation efflux family)